MLNSTHSACGLAAGMAVGLLASSPAVGLACGAVGWVFAFAPDIDHPRGRPARALGPVTWLLCRIVRWSSRAVGLPAHRGLSHAAVAAIAVGVLVAVAVLMWWPAGPAVLLGFAAAAGWAAALAGDWCTKASLPYLWWPVAGRAAGPPEWMRLRTGGLVEKLVVLPGALAGSAVLAWLVVT